MKFYTARQVVSFLFAASCCLTAYGECSSATLPKNSDAEQRRREKILLCNASRMFIDWNTTFNALQKRAMKANVTITTILEILSSYKSVDAVRARTDEAILGVHDAMSNTTAALATAHDFMNGIERDFFNAFEGIKHEPHTFTFGHSNLNLRNKDKRVSEVLEMFENIESFLSVCRQNEFKTMATKNVVLDVMEVVDEDSNFTDWGDKRRRRWYESLSHVDSWLRNMESHTSSAKTNIWSYSSTIRNITKADCATILGHSRNSRVTNLPESARNNMFRHLHDIVNENVSSSIKENGCNSIYQEFAAVGIKIGLGSKVVEGKDAVQKLCEKLLDNKTFEENCTTEKTPINWINSRFKTAIPKMVTYLNQTLKCLSFVETVVKNATKYAAESGRRAREALKEVLEKQRSELCDVMTRLGEINRNTSLLMHQVQNEEENSIVERLRAERSSEAAREAADRSASASVYASEAVKMHKETGEAVRGTRRGTRILVRSGKTALSINEKQIHKINGTLVSAFLNITKKENRIALVPCDTQFEFNVTEDLTGALRAIERLASLTNASSALATLNALQQSGKQVVHLARQAKESADAAEQASKAAQKAAEDSKCTPLYLQLFHVLGHDG
ncbi:hypothetical protein, conserved in T. vivax [Trypanosoma vivax Y486]|uniref:Uncharacterized protein n=1 Tax=Trypanosoma vivax (strain Y486) TaxID=1055687 RepID=F9WLH9_TRYVY|nr:hypothetical protein, conserved in T. vivax [Trypanosoma vivax Y486]|eukprot:CCD18371.1 hypothetical protein, conserved in T. vivax [Trypanosoma vivax Y486]